MYNPNYLQYIFKQSSGKVWNLYYDEKSGLCYSNLNKRSSWTEPISIQKNLHHIFYADMDHDDHFHFLFQTSQGNIIYTTMNNGISKSYPVLNSKIPQCYNKHLYLVPFKSNIHFFYTLKHNGSVILAHQTFINGSISAPRVIDYVTESEVPYSAVYDITGNIYVFYLSSDGRHMQIGYKKYNFSQKLWGEFTPITKYTGDVEFPRTIMDSRNIIHLCYQRRSTKQFELVYQQKVPDKNMWSDEIVVHSSIYAFDSASVLCMGNRIIIYWIRDDIIYYSISDDNGSSWSKASRYNFPVGRQLVCMSYNSNMSSEAGKVIAPTIPGSFINGMRIAFYQESFNQSSEISAEELRSLLLDGLKLLKGSVEELKESDNMNKENITRLTALHQNFEKEMVKYSLRINMLESEINQLKQLNARLENYNEMINDLKSKLDYTNTATDDYKSQALTVPGRTEPPSHSSPATSTKKTFRLKKL